MTQPGYPDYERLSLQSGILLYGNNIAITTTIVAFQGYVGNLSYIDFFWNAVGGSDSYSIALLYFNDSSFSIGVAQTVSYRNGNSEGYRQFAILAPWVQIQVTPKAGGSATGIQIAFYGCMGESGNAKLGGFTKSIWDSDGTIAAGGSVTTTLTAVSPGPAILSVFTVAVVWDCIFSAYDFPSNTFKTFFRINSTSLQIQGSFIVAMPDSIVQTFIKNADTASKVMAFHLMPMM